mmetsp:Transcript_16641/g.16002  ORF Transcript_16641/g.16002 Transcript_16641/m.16002 type:complete len:98 (-) Transcript_16641:581-874(-)
MISPSYLLESFSIIACSSKSEVLDQRGIGAAAPLGDKNAKNRAREGANDVCDKGYKNDSPKGLLEDGPGLNGQPEKQTALTNGNSRRLKETIRVPIE